MKKVLYRFLFFAIVFSSFSACKKEETEDPKIIPAVGKITAEKIVAKPLEVVLLNTENIQFKSTSYQGTFNGQTVQMNTNENKLVFAVPNLPKGNYPFQTTLEGVSFSTTYTIDSVGSFNNTDQFIVQHVPLLTLSDTLIDKIVSATTGMGDDASNLTNAQILKKYRDDFKTALAKATPEAKAEFASFVWANPKLFQPFEDVSVQKDSFNIARLGGTPNCPELKLCDIQKGLNSRIADFITITILYSAVNAATFTIPGVNFIVGAATAGDLMYLVWSMNNWLQIQLDKAIIACTNPDLFSVTRGTYEFSKDEPYTLGVKVAYRNANQTDVGSSSPVLSDIVTNLNKYGNKWNSLMQLVPTAFTGIPFHIKNVTKTKTKQMVVNPDYLAIEIMDNSAVDVNIADADGFVGTFKTTAQTDQNFQFRIYYEFEKINETYQTYQGVLLVNKPDCSTLKSSVTRNGKTITASATGGKAPYQYAFGGPFMSSVNTFNLVRDGLYEVIVQDANGCRDTARGCVNDVVINTFQMAASSPTGTPNGILTFNYTSSLGLIPEFILYNKTNGGYYLYFLSTGGNSLNYPNKVDDYCNNESFGGLAPKAYAISGDEFSRTMKFTFSNYSQPAGSISLKLRLLNSCNGVNVCNGNPLRNALYGPEYSLSW